MADRAARVGDATTHGDPLDPGPGSPNIEILNEKAWRTTVDTHQCKLHGSEACYLGSITVLLNGRMASRRLDVLTGSGPVNPITGGASTVLIGDKSIGLASGTSDFCRAFREIVANWSKMKPDERLAALQDAVNSRLAVLGVPPIGVAQSSNIGNASGQFDFVIWAMNLNTNVVNHSTLTPDQAAELANVVYHESRHTEQWYYAAQYRANAPNMSAAQLSTEFGIPYNVAVLVMNNPSVAGTAQYVLGEAVYDSVYGSRSAYRNQVLTALSKNASGEVYNQYRALPEEADAWRVGDGTGGCR